MIWPAEIIVAYIILTRYHPGIYITMNNIISFIVLRLLDILDTKLKVFNKNVARTARFRTGAAFIAVHIHIHSIAAVQLINFSSGYLYNFLSSSATAAIPPLHRWRRYSNLHVNLSRVNKMPYLRYAFLPSWWHFRWRLRRISITERSGTFFTSRCFHRGHRRNHVFDDVIRSMASFWSQTLYNLYQTIRFSSLHRPQTHSFQPSEHNRRHILQHPYICI